jgi:hypothetical protein
METTQWLTVEQLQEYNQKFLDLNYIIRQWEEATKEKQLLQKELALMDPRIKTEWLPNFKAVNKEVWTIDSDVIKWILAPQEYQACLVFNDKLARDLWFHDERIPKDKRKQTTSFYLQIK